MLIYISLDYNIRATMFKKITITLITTIALIVNVNASSDGELLLKKNAPTEVKSVGKVSIELLLH